MYTMYILYLFAFKVNGEVEGEVIEWLKVLEHVIVQFLVPPHVRGLHQ